MLERVGSQVLEAIMQQQDEWCLAEIQATLDTTKVHPVDEENAVEWGTAQPLTVGTSHDEA